MYLRWFGKRLRFARKQSGWKTVDVAEKLGVSKYTVTEYENERIIPSIDKVFAMAKLYGCSIDWLCGLGVDGI